MGLLTDTKALKEGGRSRFDVGGATGLESGEWGVGSGMSEEWGVG